jgi:Spy/CpxP family protein refolding chaperone
MTLHKRAPIVLAASFVFLTGFRSGCGRELTADEKAKRIERHSTAMVDDVMDDVDATDAQRAQAHVIKERILKAGLPQIAEQEKAKVFFEKQWLAEAPDRAGIHQIVDERADAFKALLHVAADGAIELHQLLTAEQRKEIAENF